MSANFPTQISIIFLWGGSHMYLELWKTKTKNGYLAVSKNGATPNHPSQKQPWLSIETKKTSVTKGDFRDPYISHYTSILSALYHLYIPIFVSESQIPWNLIPSPWYSHLCQLNPKKNLMKSSIKSPLIHIPKLKSLFSPMRCWMVLDDVPWTYPLPSGKLTKSYWTWP